MEHPLRQAGYIKNGKTGPENTVEKLDFYWVVTSGFAFSEWENNVPYKDQEAGNGNKGMEKLVNECLKVHVNQYALPVTDEYPTTFSQLNAENLAF